jgi:cell shape-determining protein MreC
MALLVAALLAACDRGDGAAAEELKRANAELAATNARERADLEKLAKENAELHSKLAELNHQLNELNGLLTQTRQDLDAARAKLDNPAPEPKPPLIETGTPGPGQTIRATVQAVDNKVDICVISAGAKNGVISGMEFVVTRKGEPVATVVIEKVFPNYSSGSKKPGVAQNAVQPGDDCVVTASAAPPK